MRQYLTFGGHDSRTYGVYISGQGTFNSPARAYEMQPVPGRNGDLIGNDRRFENIEVTYPAFVYTNFRTAMANWRNVLLSQEGYQRLIDTYHPDEYRLATFIGPLEVEAEANNKAGQFDLTFNCKPQRFLLSGDTVQTFTGNGSITNPTLFPAKPLIRIYGTGKVGIGSNAITVTYAPGSYTDVDCEMMDAYYGATNCNRFVRIQNNDFPTLPAGATGITLQNGVTKVEITPRWWRV